MYPEHVWFSLNGGTVYSQIPRFYCIKKCKEEITITVRIVVAFGGGQERPYGRSPGIAGKVLFVVLSSPCLCFLWLCVLYFIIKVKS
jgi:hypothetical protein